MIIEQLYKLKKFLENRDLGLDYTLQARLTEIVELYEQVFFWWGKADDAASMKSALASLFNVIQKIRNKELILFGINFLTRLEIFLQKPIEKYFEFEYRKATRKEYEEYLAANPAANIDYFKKNGKYASEEIFEKRHKDYYKDYESYIKEKFKEFLEAHPIISFDDFIEKNLAKKNYNTFKYELWNQPDFDALLKKIDNFYGYYNKPSISTEDIKKIREFYRKFIQPVFLQKTDGSHFLGDDASAVRALSVMLKKYRNEGMLPKCEKLEDMEMEYRAFQETLDSPSIKKLMDENILTKPLLVSLLRKKDASSIPLNLDAIATSLYDSSKILGAKLCYSLILITLNNKNIDPAYLTTIVHLATELSDPKERGNSKITPELREFTQAINTQTISKDTWEDFKEKLSKVFLAARVRKYPEKPLDEVMNDFINKSNDVLFPLSAAEMAILRKQYEEIKSHEAELTFCDEIKLKEKQDNCRKILRAHKEKPSSVSPTDYERAKLELLAIIRERIKRVFGVFPYNVQMLNVLAYLNDPNKRKLAQIKTGEGKSITIAILAAFLAYTRKVDIATTSDDLATRDAQKFKPFFKSLGLEATDCPEGPFRRQTASAFKADIVYMPTHAYEHAYIFEGLGDEHVRAGRPFEAMIVDEVDSMFLDTQDNPARVSGEGEEYTEELYKDIWKYLHSDSTLKTAKALQVHLKESQKQEFTLKRIQDWIESVRAADDHQLNRDYIIDKGKVKIVDYRNTGQVDSGNSQWSKGVHSFVEVKHDLEITPEDATSGQIGHAEFFNLYPELYGLTGTLGTEDDRVELFDTYGITMHDSPPYRASCKKPDPHIVCDDKEAQLAAIEKDVADKVAAGRPVLLICETIKDSMELFERLKNKSKHVQLYNGAQKEPAELLLSLAGNPGTVTIATNTAGRGADISITEESEKNGGLHVIVSFPTINKRVETQAFGRTGRQGKPGTYHYILDRKNLSRYVNFWEKFESDVFIETWYKRRAEENIELSLRRYQKKCLRILQFNFQKLFFSLPTMVRNSFINLWTKHFTELDDLFSEIKDELYRYEASKSLPLALEIKAKKAVGDALISFWKESKLAESLSARVSRGSEQQRISYGSPLHTALETNNIDLALMLIEFHPELLAETDSNGKTPLDIADGERLSAIISEKLASSKNIERLVASRILQKSDIKALMHIRPKTVNMAVLCLEQGIEGILGTSKILGVEITSRMILSMLKNRNIDMTLLGSLMNIAVQLYNRKEKDGGRQFGEFLTLLATETITNKTWFQIKNKLSPAMLALHHQKFPEKPLEVVLHEFRTVAFDVAFPLEDAEVEKLGRQYQTLQTYGTKLSTLDDFHLRAALASFKTELLENPLDEKAKLQLLALIREQIKRTFGVFPYNVQMLNVLAYLNDPKGRSIAQIKTGEGKSITIAMLAAFLGFTQTVDIATTSRDLAKRDAEKFTSFFQSLGLTVAHLADGESDISEPFQARIVYGPLEQFEFAYLFDGLGEARNRGTRPYEAMIVDEVDNMFLDTQDTPAIIASSIDAYTPELYKNIWQYCNQTWNVTTASLGAFLKEKTGKEFSLQRLDLWIHAVKVAHDYEEGKDYIILKDEVRIVDYRHTGQVHASNMRWQHGIHSFVEVKHGLTVKPEDGTSGQITHTDYFNLYQRLHGMTGTLGTQSDRVELNKLYNISMFDSPPYKPSLKVAENFILGEDGDAQDELILKDIKEKIAQGRPILLICETIRDSERYYNLLKNIGKHVQLYNAKQEESAEHLLSLAGNAGTITIATNTAGRGADITVSDDAEANGGLHVVVTYPTINKRVETQAFGRTGRQGRKGTFRYILDRSELEEYLGLEEEASEKLDDNQIYQLWFKQREEKNTIASLHRRQKHELRKMQFAIQKFFFALATITKKDCRETWTNAFTQLEKDLDVIKDMLHRHDPRNPMPAVLQRAIHEAFMKCFTAVWMAVKGSQERTMKHLETTRGDRDYILGVGKYCEDPAAFAKATGNTLLAEILAADKAMAEALNVTMTDKEDSGKDTKKDARKETHELETGILKLELEIDLDKEAAEPEKGSADTEEATRDKPKNGKRKFTLALVFSDSGSTSGSDSSTNGVDGMDTDHEKDQNEAEESQSDSRPAKRNHGTKFS